MQISVSWSHFRTGITLQRGGETQNELNGRLGWGSKLSAWEADSDERGWMREYDQNTLHKIIKVLTKLLYRWEVSSLTFSMQTCILITVVHCLHSIAHFCQLHVSSLPVLSLNSRFCFVLRTSGFMQGHLYVCAFGTPIRAAGLNSGRYLVWFSWNNFLESFILLLQFWIFFSFQNSFYYLFSYWWL